MKKIQIFIESARAFKSSTAFVITFSALIPFFLWMWKPDFKIPLWIFIATSAFLFLMIFFLSSIIKVLYKLYKKEQDKMIRFPKLASVREEGSTAIFIVQKSYNFSFNSFVTVYLEEENDDEMLLAIGKVINIQEKMMQIRILEWQGTEEIYTKTISNNKYTISKIIIKPYVSEDQIFKLIGGQ